jgi:23S rRNA (guanosine2251-2'-O)-methyltransferase
MKEWIVGRNPVYEVLRAHRRDIFRLWIASGVQEKNRIQDILSLAATYKISPSHVLRSQVDALGENPQGVAIEVGGYPYVDLLDILRISQVRKDPLFVLVLDQIQNPQNLGSLIRTAEAAGMHGIVLPLAHSVGITPAVVGASAGACEHILVALSNLAQAISILKEAGVWVIGLDQSQQSQSADQIKLTGPLAIVVGSEGEGIRSLVRSSCDFLMRLPMVGKVESLNAAVAGSVAVYRAFMERKAASQAKHE